MRAPAALLRRWRAPLAALGLAVAMLGLAVPLAHADVWANVGPGPSLAGLKGTWSLGSYELDEHFTAISAGVFSGIDVSGLLPMIAFFFANLLWQFTAWLANLLIELFGFAFSLDLVNGSAATGGAGALGPVSRAIGTIYTTVFGGPWMVLAVSFASLWAMWKALVQRRYAETASQLALSLIYVCVAFLFVLEPGQTIGTASHWTNEMSGAFLSIAKDGEPSTQSEAKEAGADQLFGLLVSQPWAVLEFGGLEHCVKTGTAEGGEPESVPVEPIAPAAARSLEAGQTVTTGGKTCVDNLKKYGPHFLRMAPGSKEREEEEEALAAGDASKLPESDPGKKNGSYELGPVDTPAAASMEKGGQYQRLLVSVVVFACELGAFCLLGALSIGIVVAQVLLLLLLAFSPVALVAATIPGRGHQFFKAWLSKLAGYLLRKAAYSLILAILLAVCAAISSATSQLGWLFSFGLQCAFFWAVFIQRRSLTDGLVGVVTGPDAPGRDRTLSLLALYAGARVGNRAVLRPPSRAGRRAGNGAAWAGRTFLGLGRGRGRNPVAPLDVPGVPIGGKRVHVDLGGRGRSRGPEAAGGRSATRRRPERRPGDRAMDRPRRRPDHQDARGGEQEAASAGEARPSKGSGRRGAGRQAAWRRRSRRRAGRAAGRASTPTPTEAGAAPSSRVAPPATRPPRPRPPRPTNGESHRPPAQEPGDGKRSDLAEELRDDARHQRAATAPPRPEPPAKKDERGPDERRDGEGRGR
ncbi:MAG: hypothetical protein JSU06_00535 [Actinobacteria bacterium]|nr:hypothetical protein [Actinomycetota bacterium]